MASEVPIDVRSSRFNFSDVVSLLCSRIKQNRSTGKTQSRAYKTRDKWVRLTAQIPQAVSNCMQGEVIIDVFKYSSLHKTCFTG